jgi:hypothetical protein
MNRVSTELWRKPETVPLSKFPSSCHEPIRKGLQVIKGEISDLQDEIAINEQKEAPPTHFTGDEMHILRERLGVELVHGNHTLEELKQILYEEELSGGHSFKRR